MASGSRAVCNCDLFPGGSRPPWPRFPVRFCIRVWAQVLEVARTSAVGLLALRSRCHSNGSVSLACTVPGDAPATGGAHCRSCGTRLLHTLHQLSCRVWPVRVLAV